MWLLVFDGRRSLSNSGIAAGLRLIAARCVWLSVSKDVRIWAKQRLHFQRTKGKRYTVSFIGIIAAPDASFNHVRVDISNSLAPLHGNTYLLFRTDWFRRYFEAIPISTATTETAGWHSGGPWIASCDCLLLIRTIKGNNLSPTYYLQLQKYWLSIGSVQPLIIGHGSVYLKDFIASPKRPSDLTRNSTDLKRYS